MRYPSRSVGTQRMPQTRPETKDPMIAPTIPNESSCQISSKLTDSRSGSSGAGVGSARDFDFGVVPSGLVSHRSSHGHTLLTEAGHLQLTGSEVVEEGAVALDPGASLADANTSA